MNTIKIILSCIIFLSVTINNFSQVRKINYEAPEQVGKFKDSRINEASGMAFSYNTTDAFWVHNDSGDGPNIFLLNKSGDLLTDGKIAGATSDDWEDMASFQMDGKSYLIMGDFGDNAQKRSEYRLYIIEEPTYDSSKKSSNSYPILRTIKYTYDDGKQNCESIAVDTTTEKIILFGKSHKNEIRNVYEMPLSIASGTITTTATKIASLRSDDTTAMDISNDGHRAIVLTYKDFAYEFVREDNETWATAFNKTYRKITMPIGRAGEEAIAYDTNGIDIYTVREGQGSEVYYLKGLEEEDPNSPNKAKFVSQSSVPKTIGKGEIANVSITIKNTGTSTWTKSAGYKLGNFDNNAGLGLTEVELADSDEVKPNEEKVFNFTITGPTNPGAYNFQWRMLKGNSEWFGEITPKKQVVVLESNKYFDNCDSTSDWNPGSLILNTDDKVQGTAALEFSGTNTDEYSKVFSNPFDAQGSRFGTTLQFWYYVSDPTKFDGQNQVEISSSGKPDTNEYSWSLSNIKQGWNFIKLHIKDANRSGNPDLSKINWFRLYRFKNGSVTTKIDAIQLIGENSLSLNTPKKNNLFKVYPNPTKSQLHINFTLAKLSKINIKLVNSLGQVVSKKINNKFVNSGLHHFKIATKHLKAGVYFAKINVDGKISSKKIIVQ